MILDPNDPTGLGLFSRCGRNQACRSKKSRPKSAISRKSVTEINFQESKKKDASQNWMGKIQSREQRQRKYKKQTTPAVGQYNPAIKQKPKLVWDMLKIYQKKNKQLKKLQDLHSKIDKQKNKVENIEQDTGENQNQNFEQEKQNETKMQKNPINFEQNKQQQEYDEQNKQIKIINNRRMKTSVSQNDHCFVNMSRMTGRSQSIRKSIQNDINTVDRYSMNYETDLNKSISKIKSKTTQNIYFNKMIGRKQNVKMIGTANIYDCNMDLVRPVKKGFLDFAIIKGRKGLSNRSQQNSFNSFTYYDFNEYVWNSTSSIFRNTKRGLIPFNKQYYKK